MTDTRHKMEVQRRAKSSSSASKSSSALDVKVGSATSCSPVSISWDASSGEGPWTIMIAPINFTPITISVPNASGSQAQFIWNAPAYSSRASTTAFIAVSDASGDVSGVSSKITIGPSSSSCSGPSTNMDFVWYPSTTSTSPAQCADWTIVWQRDNKNNGIVAPVTFTFLPENGTPLTVSAGSTTSSGGRFDFTIPWSSGTEFAAIANDAGSAGTGGVGDLYSVSSGRTSCSAASNLGNGLPAARTTSSITASSATATSTSTKSSGGKSSAASSTSSSGSAFPNQATAGSSSGQSHVGTAVGATFGVLAALAVIFGLIWFLKRRSREKEYPFEKGTEQPSISPWRWSASPYEAPATNSRASRWLGKASSIAPTKGFKALAELSGHGHSNSTSYSMSGAQTHARKRSSMSQGFSDKSQSQSPTQTFGQTGHGNPTFRNVVPDTALFPPPRPMGTSPGEGVHGGDQFEGVARAGNSADYYFGIGQPGAMPPPKRKPVSVGPDGYPPYYPSDKHPEYDYSGEVSPSRTNTSDPFSNSAGVDQNVVTHEIQRGAQQQYSAPLGVTSEVMMPDGSYRSVPRTNTSGLHRHSRNSEEGLPYL